MGKVKRAKKFRKNHLKDKIDQRRREQKHDKLIGRKKSKKPTSQPHEEPETNGIDAPKQDLTFLEEDAAFEKYLSDSDASDASDGSNDNSSDGLDDEADVAAEEAAWLNGENGVDENGEEAESDGEDLTKETIEGWVKQLDKTLKPTRLIVRALAAEDTVTDASTFDLLLKVGLHNVPQALRHHLPLTENKTPVQTKRFTEYTPALKIYCQVLTDLLKNSSSRRISQVLSAAQKSIPYFISLRKLIKEFIKALASVIVNRDLSDEVKLEAYSVLQDSCTAYPNALTDPALKYSYEGLVKLCGRTSSHTIGTINLAKNVFANLYSVDPTAGYQTAFQQVRTLALHLKASLDKQKNPEMTTKVIYTWQYVQSLDFFSRVISAAPEKSPLHQLIHPLVQVTLRTATLVPSPAYFPLRFYLVRSLIRLSRHTGVYIPLAPILVEVLSSSTVSKRGKKSSLQQFDFDNNIRASANYIGTQVYQNSVSDELVDMFVEVFVLYSKSIAFPELVSPVITTLKRFTKRSSNARLNKQLSTLVERLVANSEYIVKQRDNVTFGPRDKELVAAFLKEVEWEKTPLGSLAVTRRKVREDRIKLLQNVEDDEEQVEGLSGLEDSETGGSQSEDDSE